MYLDKTTQLSGSLPTEIFASGPLLAELGIAIVVVRYLVFFSLH